MKNKVILIVIFIIVVALAIVGFIFLKNTEDETKHLEDKMITASNDYFKKYISANDSVNVYKITLQDLQNANKNGESYDLSGLEKCDKNKTFANVTIDYKDGTAKKTQVELKC